MKFVFTPNIIKYSILVLLSTIYINQLFAHDVRQAEMIPSYCWQISGDEVEASFLMHKNNKIFLELADGIVTKHDLNEFSQNDQQKLQKLILHIEDINAHHHSHDFHIAPISSSILFLLLLVILLTILIYYRKRRNMAFSLGAFIVIIILSGFKYNVLGPLTDPLFIDAAFAPHKHRLKTRWDDNWFYVENNGLPDHVMMKGIVKWQQQVPLPQCYTGTNSWQIPLNPEIASNPIPVNQMHFLRGAIAIATNGIAIFNPYTTSGQDAYTDGQLDIYGGHSGRADDYHYHTAPFHLQDNNKNLPIAFALDGYAVYGDKEPDGSPMKPLDDFHGHFGDDGVYHYHGTKESPYMIGKMKGKVTEDATMQLIPQPRANGVRPALTPLNGAVITDFVDNGQGNGYILTYTRNGQEYKVEYSWTTNGKYTYNFVSPTGTVTEVYNGSAPCGLITATEEFEVYHKNINVYPVPTSSILNIDIKSPYSEVDIKEISMYDFNGIKVFNCGHSISSIDLSCYAKGIYNVQIKTKNNIVITKKVVVQ